MSNSTLKFVSVLLLLNSFYVKSIEKFNQRMSMQELQKALLESTREENIGLKQEVERLKELVKQLEINNTQLTINSYIAPNEIAIMQKQFDDMVLFVKNIEKKYNDLFKAYNNFERQKNQELFDCEQSVNAYQDEMYKLQDQIYKLQAQLQKYEPKN